MKKTTYVGPFVPVWLCPFSGTDAETAFESWHVGPRFRDGGKQQPSQAQIQAVSGHISRRLNGTGFWGPPKALLRPEKKSDITSTIMKDQNGLPVELCWSTKQWNKRLREKCGENNAINHPWLEMVYYMFIPPMKMVIWGLFDFLFEPHWLFFVAVVVMQEELHLWPFSFLSFTSNDPHHSRHVFWCFIWQLFCSTCCFAFWHYYLL